MPECAQVAIVDGGPAGLLLGTLRARHGDLAEVAPSTNELIYARDDRGPALGESGRG